MNDRGALFADYARRYSEIGWGLVRLSGKAPKGKGWQQLEADPDPEHAAGMWSTWGHTWNVGLVLASARVAVVEYDTEEGAARLRELFGGTRPLTPTANRLGPAAFLLPRAGELPEGCARRRRAAARCPSGGPSSEHALQWRALRLARGTGAMGVAAGRGPGRAARVLRRDALERLSAARGGDHPRARAQRDADLVGRLDAPARDGRGGDPRRARGQQCAALPAAARGPRARADRPQRRLLPASAAGAGILIARPKGFRRKERIRLGVLSPVRAPLGGARERRRAARLAVARLRGPRGDQPVGRPPQGRQVDAYSRPSRRPGEGRPVPRPGDCSNGGAAPDRGAALRHPPEGRSLRFGFFQFPRIS